MIKVKLIDFLGFVNFRYATDGNEYNTKIVRILYPDKDDMSFSKLYDKDRYFEYGVYDFGCDTKKRLIQTINPFILNCYISSISCNQDGNLEIAITDEEDIDDLNLDCLDYDFENYEDKSNSVDKIFVCSPLRGNIKQNIENAKRYCRAVIGKTGNVPIAPHLYFTNFLDDNINIERKLGIDFGLELLSECKEIWVFDYEGISEGMKAEIEEGNRLNIPVKYASKGECV